MDNTPRRINDLVTGRNPNDQSSPSAMRKKKRKLRIKRLSISGGILALLLAIAAGIWYFNQSSTASQIDTTKYQLVYMKDGNFYFGKLVDLNGGYFKLSDVFYLQTQTATESKTPEATASSTDVKLIKLGSEIHGPEDAMIISKDQVSFFENLKKDGKVSQSIANYYGQK